VRPRAAICAENVSESLLVRVTKEGMHADECAGTGLSKLRGGRSAAAGGAG
jgi:hypothetical protein